MRNATRRLLATAGVLAALGAAAEPRPVELDRERSWLAARTGTAGLLGFLGHAHGVVAETWDARVCLDPEQPARSRLEIVIPVEGLRIDTVRALELAGLDRESDAEERAELQAEMTGPETLDAARHPEIRFRMTAFEPGADGTGRARGELTIHGVTRAVAAPVRVAGLDRGAFEAEGRLEIRQTEFGIEPESVAGVVRVADRVTLRFRLAGTLGAGSCEVAPEP